MQSVLILCCGLGTGRSKTTMSVFETVEKAAVGDCMRHGIGIANDVAFGPRDIVGSALNDVPSLF